MWRQVGSTDNSLMIRDSQQNHVNKILSKRSFEVNIKSILEKEWCLAEKKRKKSLVEGLKSRHRSIIATS